MQMVVIQGFKRIPKSRKQNVHGSLKLSRRIFIYFFFFGQSYVRFALQATIIILTTGAQQAGAGGLSFPFLI